MKAVVEISDVSVAEIFFGIVQVGVFFAGAIINPRFPDIVSVE